MKLHLKWTNAAVIAAAVVSLFAPSAPMAQSGLTKVKAGVVLESSPTGWDYILDTTKATD